MSVITTALGLYAANDISHAGILVAKTFDQSLMSINYARAAAADFASMEAAFARRWVTSDARDRVGLDAKIGELSASLDEDLGIAAERSQSARARRAVDKVRAAVAAWNEGRLHVAEAAGPNWEKLDHFAAVVDQEIDLLVNYTAGDGFTYRQSARAAVASDYRLNLTATGLALFLSAVVAWLLARRIVGPVAAASAVASRIACGDLDVEIPQGSADELGALLAAMAVMCNNIRTMMEREVAQRRSAQARLADALENSREGVVLVDADGRIALANSQAADFLGQEPELLRQGTPAAELAGALTDTGGAALLQRLDDVLPATSETRLADGRWLRISQSPTREGGFIAVSSDISVIKNQKAELQATNLRLDAALDNMSQGLCLFAADDRLEVINQRFCEIFRLPPEQVVPGMRLRNLLEMSVGAGNHGERTVDELLAESALVGRRGRGVQIEELSEARFVAVAHRRLPNGGWLATYEDVTERRQSEARLYFMSTHDALTSLPNRSSFSERIEQALTHVGRDGSFAVLCLDLDHFKEVNEILGHAFGDALLRVVAQRLQACVREVDTVARLGGDEFAILQSGAERPEHAIVLARRIVDVLGAPYDLDGHRAAVGVSIGISLAPGDGTRAEKLLKNADVALHRAKAEARGSWRFFEAEMDARLQSRRAMELDLRDALVKNEFELVYQPLYDLNLERITGFEALLRWRHPDRGLVSPVDFIPLAEEIGFIVPLGEWVLRHACAQVVRWPGHIKLAVNVSAAQIKTGRLVEVVTGALRASGLAPQRLELEITESVLLADSAATVATLHALRNLGVRISMDDFGTGYSSLSYLRSFPFDKIKIDQTFIRDLATAQGSDAIVRAITSLGRSLGMRTTAEGVETEQQLAWLRLEGCDEVQGYLISRPTPPSEVARLIDHYGSLKRAVA